MTADDTQGSRADGPHDSGHPTPVLPVGAAPLSPETSVDEVDRVLDQVELALSRLDDGTYGQCATCGSAIDDAHLADNPMAVHCPQCETEASTAE